MAVVLVALMAGPAHGWFTERAASSNTFSTATLAPPGRLVASASCDDLLGSASVDLKWRPSASPFTTGYEIFRRLGASGPYEFLGSTDAATTTYTDGPIAGTDFLELALSSAVVRYVVRARAHAWISEDSNEAVAEVGLLCFLPDVPDLTVLRRP
ncbi:hypothetical protein [Nocardioides sp.]|uniref:hypothetical protein n=1 Tax=Nocardioides sp. TaxID=35761 RepID=UPI002B2779F2|nr:hypothetical protein [Nocardioides sp.]